MWKKGGGTDAACAEAEAADSGRFNGACSARYTNVFNGFAAEVSSSTACWTNATVPSPNSEVHLS